MNKESRRAFVARSISAAGLALIAPHTLGQSIYPTKTVRILVPYTAGSPPDIIARFASDRLAKAFGQPVIVENRPGVGGTMGTAEMHRAPPDNHTLLMQPSSMLTTTSFLYQKLPYDVARDFAPIWALRAGGNVLVVNNDLPVRNVKEFVEYLKRNPGKVAFGSAGSGTVHHLAGEMFMRATNTNMLHVPYKGAVPAETDVMGGIVQAMFDPSSGATPLIQAGKIRALAVLSPTRVKMLPTVPTMRESGIPAAELPVSTIGIYAHSSMPQSLRKRIHDILDDSVDKDPMAQSMFGKLGLEGTVDGDEMSKQLAQERQYFGPLIKSLNITLD